MKQQFTGPISLDVAARTVTLHGIALPAERVLLAVNSTVGFIYHIHEHEPANISTVADATGGILSAVGYDAIGSFNGNLNIYQGGIDKGGILHISGGVITVVNKGSGYTAGFANTVGGTRLVLAIDPSFSTVIHFSAYKDCDTHQNSDAVSVFYEDGVDLGKLIKDESDETQVQLTAFQAEVKAESDATQTLLQAEFDETQTQLAAFQAEVKAESDATQTILQAEFDQTQTQLAAFQTEVKAESDETQAILNSRLAVLVDGKYPVLSLDTFSPANGYTVNITNGVYGPTVMEFVRTGVVGLRLFLTYDANGQVTSITPV